MIIIIRRKNRRALEVKREGLFISTVKSFKMLSVTNQSFFFTKLRYVMLMFLRIINKLIRQKLCDNSAYSKHQLFKQSFKLLVKVI